MVSGKKNGQLANFYPDILLFSVFEGPYIVHKLFQYYLSMLNLQHGLASLPQTTVLYYSASKQTCWKRLGREKPLDPLLNIFFHLKA